MFDALYASELTGEKLHEFAVRANALLERSTLTYPVRATLFGSSGEQLASWELRESESGPTECAHDSLEERWMRSIGGVSLTLEDATGKVAEMLLVVGQPQ